LKYSKKTALFFSLLPGAGHMYIGLIKQGIELMVLFFFIVFISHSFNFDFFNIFIPVIWCYSIFDVKTKIDQGENAKDDDLPIFKSNSFSQSFLNNNTEKYIAYILILMGIFSLIDNIFVPFINRYVDYELIRFVKDLIISIVLIGIGVFMIKGKNRHSKSGDKK
jgi:low temperature requirement protein LtrA